MVHRGARLTFLFLSMGSSCEQAANDRTNPSFAVSSNGSTLIRTMVAISTSTSSESLATEIQRTMEAKLHYLQYPGIGVFTI